MYRTSNKQRHIQKVHGNNISYVAYAAHTFQNVLSLAQIHNFFILSLMHSNSTTKLYKLQFLGSCILILWLCIILYVLTVVDLLKWCMLHIYYEKQHTWFQCVIYVTYSIILYTSENIKCLNLEILFYFLNFKYWLFICFKLFCIWDNESSRWYFNSSKQFWNTFWRDPLGSKVFFS